MDWLQQLPDSFAFGLVAGLVLGLVSRWALRFLAYAAALLFVVELFRMAFAV